MHFKDRRDAGRKLAEALKMYRGDNTVVYALPRGGVVLGAEIAKALKAPLDLIIARKIGHPWNPEYAVCAITENGDMLCDASERASLDPQWFKEKAAEEQAEARRRRKAYLGNTKHISAQGKRAIVVDDGIATGLTIRAAVKALFKEKPKELIVAVPVVPHDVLEILKKEADTVVALEDAVYFRGAVGAYYDDFPQVSDEEVIDFLPSKK